MTTGGVEEFDSAVLATGAWMGELARRFGVRSVVQAGRGYSFSSPIDRVPDGPVYLPAQRVACTPLGDRLRVAGMMEFRSPEARLDPRRIQAIADAARPFLQRRRPRRPRGRVGRLAAVHPRRAAAHRRHAVPAGVCGGWPRHVGHHPRPGHRALLAEQMVTGRTPAELAPFSPTR